MESHAQSGAGGHGDMHGHAGTPAPEDMAMAADITAHPACPLCNMNRAMFAYARMVLEYDDGTSYGTCSIHCAVLEMAVSLDKAPARILVADYDTKNLIDAESAVWVLGGERMGVMSKQAKWAFEDKSAAEAFIKKRGGKLADFDTVIQAAFKDMAADTLMIRSRRKMMHGK
ncbi:nitrous oxide reductase accessory protein NosL [Fundidesulfovibrio soli]|uniref:nitrous oxide reductase accessory protein NosL n=1 Tax=Fundidesulfovibrio soli TaxID=2922716 RepID=UPI001FAF73EC|nr:nitrous oxide reductase accessory protein NosL [Fundidesulfovibrio soli]